MPMSISLEAVVAGLFTILLGLISWGLRARYAETMERMNAIELRQDTQQREIDQCATRDNLASAIAEVTKLIEITREGFKRDFDGLRQGEIKEIYRIIREENREFRNELNSGLNAVRSEISRSSSTTAKSIITAMHGGDA